MAVDSIFGKNVSLPSMPDVTSSCEAELYQLMIEIDHTIRKKFGEWKKEKNALTSTLESEKKENKNLRSALKNCQQEIENLKKQLSALEHPQSNRTDECEIPKQTEQAISDQYNFQKDQFRQGEENPQVLLKIIADFKSLLTDKDRQLMASKRNEEILTSELEELRSQLQQQPMKLFLDQASVDKLITNASETMWKQEAAYREKLRQSISEDIDRLGEKLESTTFHLK